MKTNPHGEVGMYPIRPDALCINCKDKLAKRHGLNPVDGKVYGWFMGGTGPRCVWCHKEAWCDKEFWNRTGHSENAASRWGLHSNVRPYLESLKR